MGLISYHKRRKIGVHCTGSNYVTLCRNAHFFGNKRRDDTTTIQNIYLLDMIFYESLVKNLHHAGKMIYVLWNPSVWIT